MRTQKEAILQVMKEACRHMTADEVYLACRAKGIRVSLATVYRNLGIMADDHTLRRVPIPGKPDCYDTTVIEHSHIVCEVCGEVSDIDVGDLKTELEKRLGITITDYDLCLHYVCPKCRQNSAQTGE